LEDKVAFTSGTSTDYLDLLSDFRTWITGTPAWTENDYTASHLEAKTVDSIVNDGTGYVLDEIITLTGGTFSTAAQLRVTGVSGTDITSASIEEPGNYTVLPSNPVAQGSSSGSGTLATFNMTWGDNVASFEFYGPGNGASARTYVNIESYWDDPGGIFSWAIRGATGWVTGVAHGSQQGASNAHYFNLWDGSIDYWFYANDRRFIIEAKVSTNYMSCYAGFGSPNALPTEYPFPHVIGASYDSPQLPSLNNSANSMIADPGQGSMSYRKRTTETWAEVENHVKSVSASAPASGARPFVWPHKTGNASSGGTEGVDNWSNGAFLSLRPNFVGEMPLFQAHIIDTDDELLILALDGVFSTGGFGRSTEQVVTESAQDYRLFQRVNRNSARDFMAIEET